MTGGSPALRFKVAGISTRVAGIPCFIEVLSWEPYLPATKREPEGGGTGEWRVLDRRGRPAPWLQRKITPAERDRIEQMVFDKMEERA